MNHIKSTEYAKKEILNKIAAKITTTSQHVVSAVRHAAHLSRFYSL